MSSNPTCTKPHTTQIHLSHQSQVTELGTSTFLTSQAKPRHVGARTTSTRRPRRRAPAFPRGRRLMMKQKGKGNRKRAKNLEPHARWRAGAPGPTSDTASMAMSTTSILGKASPKADAHAFQLITALPQAGWMLTRVGRSLYFVVRSCYRFLRDEFAACIITS